MIAAAVHPISYLQALILGLTQGIAEPFPISSLGHGVIIPGLGRSIRARGIAPGDDDARLGWLLVIGTIPAGILGLALQHPLRTLFASAETASLFLILNGILLLAFERLRRRSPEQGDGEGDSDPRIARRVSLRQAAAIGTAQAAALVPGISRSGMTMGGGLRVGLSTGGAGD